MKIQFGRVARSGVWHAYAIFPGHETLYSLCTPGFAPATELLDRPVGSQGTEKICRSCTRGARFMRRRYREAPE